MTGAFAKPALRVLSVLEAQGDRVGDVLAALKPFFAPIVCDMAGEVFDPQKVATAINAAYYWRVTHEVIEGLVPRFIEWGWLESWYGDKNATAYKVSGNWGNLNGTDEQDIQAVATKIGDSFRGFLETHLPLHLGNKGSPELASALVEWLVSVDAFTPQKIRDRIQGYEVDEFGVMVPKLSSGTGPANSLDAQTSYLCARFVKHLADSGDSLFGDLCRLAEVGLLTEVVQDFSKPIESGTRPDLTLYVDSPLLLDALGMSGRTAKSAVLPVLDGLRGAGVKIAALRASVEELRASLDALLRTPQTERTGPTAEAMKRREILQRDVITVLNGPEAALRAIGCDVIERTLSMYPNEHKFFTADDYSNIKALYSWQATHAAQEHDAALVTIIMRRRGHHRSNDFLTSKHLAVSRNGAVIADAERYCREKGMIARGQVPPAIHSRQLATMAWLRTGLRASADVPRSTLLAACQRVLTLNPGLLKAAVRKAHELSGKTEEELRLCLTMDRSTMVLMDRTLGDTRVLAMQNIDEIVDAMKRSVAEDEIKKAREGLQAEIDSALEESKKAAAAVVAESKRQAEQRIDEARRDAEAQIGESQRQLKDAERAIEAKEAASMLANSEKEKLLNKLASLEATEKAVLTRLVEDTNRIVGTARLALMAAAVIATVGAVVTSLTIGFASLPLWILTLVLIPTAFVQIVPVMAGFLGYNLTVYQFTTPLCRKFFFWLAARRGVRAQAEACNAIFERDRVSLPGCDIV